MFYAKTPGAALDQDRPTFSELSPVGFSEIVERPNDDILAVAQPANRGTSLGGVHAVSPSSDPNLDSVEESLG